MKTFLLPVLAACTFALAPAWGQLSAPRKSSLPPEPGTLDVEDVLPKPVLLKILREAPVYSRSTLEHALGSMAPGTQVKLVGLADQACRVRGRARHGDVAGWVRLADLQLPDPDLLANVRKLHDRQRQVEEMIAAKQVALGMTAEEVTASLGKPKRKSTKITNTGREEKFEYVVYERVPQYTTGLDSFGRPVQSVVYLKVETGNLAITLKDNVVDSIEETKGNPLGEGGVKIVPGPFFFRW